MQLPLQSAISRPAKWPQYRLRTLMLFVTGCCVLFALMHELSPLASTGLIFFVLMVMFHVAGNALGTSLREQANREIAACEQPLPPPQPAARRIANSPSRLGEHTSLGRPVLILTALGALVGGALSSLAYAYWTNVSMAQLLVGSISTAIVGGFLGFLASSFLKITFRAWRQASEI